jgi:hypothetical protein
MMNHHVTVTDGREAQLERAQDGFESALHRGTSSHRVGVSVSKGMPAVPRCSWRRAIAKQSVPCRVIPPRPWQVTNQGCTAPTFSTERAAAGPSRRASDLQRCD